MNKITKRKIYCGIYMIRNKINDKKYIGQSVDIWYRYRNHLSESYNRNCNKKAYNMAIHKAIRKYGENNFEIIVLEECSEEKLDEREIYWIDYYDTYNNGYNQTIGGDSFVKRIDRNNIYRLWDDGNSVSEIHKITGHNKHNIIYILEGYDSYSSEESRRRGIKVYSKSNSKRVYMYDINGKYICEFSSITDASKKTNTSHGDISACIHGRQKSANNYMWSLEKTDNIGEYNATMTNKKKKVLKYDSENNFIEEFDSITAAAKSVGLKGLSGIITSCKNGSLCRGYKWRFKDDNRGKAA